MNKYDVIILATEKNIPTLKVMIPYCQYNIPYKKIYVIANKVIRKEIESIPEICYFDENDVYPNLCYTEVEKICNQISDKNVRVGWYLQQFLKLAWAYKCTDDKYIVIDADTIPLNPIEFEKNGRCLFTGKTEYNQPYFDTISKLFNGEVTKGTKYSFVAEHMMFDCAIVKEMLNKICENANLVGNNFYEKILYAVGKDNLVKSGFSEFETYGNYMLTYYDKLMEMRKLRTEREAVYILGSQPSDEQLAWAAKDCDIISIEVNDYHRTLITTLSGLEAFRLIIKFRSVAKIRRRIRTIYRKVIGKADFVYETE